LDINAQRQSYLAAAGKGLGHLWRKPGTLQIRDEKMPEVAKVAIKLVVVRVKNNLRRSPLSNA